MTADFKLSVDRYQVHDPSSTEFFDAEATVDCRGFSGRTAFVISRRDVERFLDDIARIRSMASDSAQLLGGWDDAEERLRLEVTRAGRSDGFLARVRIATAAPDADQWNRVETEFICPRESMQAFQADLAALVGERKQGMVVLSGDAQAIA